MKPLADRTDNLAQSDIRAITHVVNQRGGVNLGQGVNDLPTPSQLQDSAREAIAEGHSTYTSHMGIKPLRERIFEKLTRFNDLPCESPDEVMVSSGSTGAFVTAILALLNDGDEVLLFEPFYGYHRKLIELVGGTTRSVPLSYPGWNVKFDALEHAVKDETKAIILNTPSNPTGKVWTADELTRLYQIAEAKDVYVVTDEIYEYMTYDGIEHCSPASIPGAYERTITISGFSKAYNMTGWRLGYAAAPEPLIEKMGLINDLLYICAPAPLQHAVLEAFELDESYLTDLRTAYTHKRKKLGTTLEEVGFDVTWPEGSYYFMANLKNLSRQRDGFDNCDQASQTLLEEAGVAAVPGKSFFENPADGQYFLRFCFAKKDADLEEACKGLKEGLEVRTGTAG